MSPLMRILDVFFVFWFVERCRCRARVEKERHEVRRTRMTEHFARSVKCSVNGQRGRRIFNGMDEATLQNQEARRNTCTEFA